ncbi:epoxide hydrolase [Sinorhizobium meliloti]|uniref:epoxide hydrolase family protein n=1 Tax=Rhizobium meliloti TaxID=382 RepID=UPI0002A55C2F|nr:epoxide hydrolase [Sinorhizobium meliloti]AGA08983.1 putative hydrolases or acyltransferases (alpha/beta hydrolase superfamily) [Sinorhizobium meliloti GR4]RVL04897.1 epoxide hydrolase [Sinorhizobium meliloti]RVM94299.1 epoxide hydrolase [Sinorhizobium meliloti]RVN01341.1 epoxide hydrolase [Sinorhizobium meliloti]
MSTASPAPTRRTFLATSATALLATSAGAAALSFTSAQRASAAEASSIRPFTINFPDGDLADLRRRIAATRWPERELVTDAASRRTWETLLAGDTQGVQLATMQKLIQYWGTDYDWSKCEARLRALPHFVTELDGLDIHFIHVRSKHQGALPVIITHGWPGSVIEMLKIIDPLTNPTAHGGTAADAFDVVIPSMPGYGFSAKPTEPGWDPLRIARSWIVLMERLGYNRYTAQGGDWGALITEEMALLAPPELIAVHSNMPGTIPPEIVKALGAGSPPPADLGPDEKNAYEQVAFFYKFGLGYANEMALRPQTLYGIVDSPAGLASWILDHDADSYALIARSFDGKAEGLTRDDILDNITLYWLTNTAISSAQLYWEHRRTATAGFFDAKGVTIPIGVSAYPSEIYTAPKSWTERAFPKLLHYGRPPQGCHFAAWEQPQYFTEELRASFKTLRT